MTHDLKVPPTPYEELLTASRIAYEFFNREVNTPDENDLVVAPDSMVRVILRKLKQAIVKAEVQIQ